MASDITISSLTAVGGLGQIAVTVMASSPMAMVCLPYMQPASIDVYASATASFTNAARVGTVDSSVGIFIHGGLGDNVTRYYWAIPFDPEGNAGSRYPAGAGIGASTKTATPGPNSITEDMLQDGSLSKQKFVAGITPVEIVASLPATGNYAGRMVFRTTDGKLFRHTGSPANASGFTAAVPAVDITGRITHEQINTPSLSALSANLGIVTAGTLAANVAYLGAVSAAQIATTSLSAISANLGTITAGDVQGATFTGGTIRTSLSPSAVVMGSTFNDIAVWRNAVRIARMGHDVNGSFIATISVIDATGRQGALIYTSGGGAAPAAAFMRGGSGVAVMADAQANTAGSAAVRGVHATGGSGVVGVAPVEGGFGFYAISGGYGPFTGSHDALIAKEDEAVPGDIVCDVRVVQRSGWGDTLTEVERSNTVGQRGAIGILDTRMAFDPMSDFASYRAPADHRTPHQRAKGKGRIEEPGLMRRRWAERYDRLKINSVGEGQMNVCGRNGDLEKGDLIIASDLPGKGQKQDDDIVRSYTVAKVREPVRFDHPDQVKVAAVIYLCG